MDLKFTDPKTARRLKIKRIERRILYVIGISTALERDFEQAADVDGYEVLGKR